MLQTEFVKNLHCNYERVLLEKKPEEKRYQYCILARGGIKGLLPCSLRYMNGLAYLYYDITSKQSVEQLFVKRAISRKWVKDFLWSFQQIRQELGRFLLEERNILWYPQQIFQDLEQNIFSFLYMPYYEGEENGFHSFLEFLVEHINYEDEGLVDCVYKMYERFEQNGDVYLQGQIFEDVKLLDGEQTAPENNLREEWSAENMGEVDETQSVIIEEKEPEISVQEKRGLFSFLESRKRKSREQRDRYRQNLQLSMEGHAVAEEFPYGEEDYGRTVYIEEPKEKKNIVRRLYTSEGKIVAQLDENSLTIGKKKGEVDLVLEDLSISRVHARITKEGEDYYLEDMNSTNGTTKNGLRLQPYEKRKLEEEDEIQLGSIPLIFR